MFIHSGAARTPGYTQIARWLACAMLAGMAAMPVLAAELDAHPVPARRTARVNPTINNITFRFIVEPPS